MEGVRTFLESSTVHGLSYISTTRKFGKFFWILVVIAGFTGAGILIYQSFNDWAESPVTTTIETLPITQIKFPNVTVCPPKNTYTDLNYDLMRTENITLESKTREEILQYGVELLNDLMYETLMNNLNVLQDNEKYSNWYNGYTQLRLPFPNYGYDNFYPLYTYATSGFISTQYFHDKFEVDKVETKVWYNFYIDPPNNFKHDKVWVFNL